LRYFYRKYEEFYKSTISRFNILEDYKLFLKQYYFFEKYIIPLIKKITEIQGEFIYFDSLQSCCNSYIFNWKISKFLKILQYKAEVAKLEVERLRNHISVNLTILSILISIVSIVDFFISTTSIYLRLLIIAFIWLLILIGLIKRIRWVRN